MIRIYDIPDNTFSTDDEDDDDDDDDDDNEEDGKKEQFKLFPKLEQKKALSFSKRKESQREWNLKEQQIKFNLAFHFLFY